MTVTALIPAYNAAAYLEATLASVHAQTRKPDEIIVVDDASTDNTTEVARRLGAKVITLKQNSGGPAAPLNYGIQAAQSEWLATLDHDDRWHPGWLAAALDAAEAAEVNLVFGRVQTSNGQANLDARCDGLARKGRPRGKGFRLDSRTAYNELVPALNYAITCSNLVFSRSLGERTKFDTNVRLCCDYRFMQQVTRRHDIAFLSTYSCDWMPSATSLYQRGAMDPLDRDLFYVYRQFDRSYLDAEMQAIVRAKCQQLALDLAYGARERGEYRRAAKDYLSSLSAGRLNRTALLGLLKLPLIALRGER